MEVFLYKFTKCCFHKCIHSSRLVAFRLAFAELFLLLTPFIVCHVVQSNLLSFWSDFLCILFVLLGICYLIHFVPSLVCEHWYCLSYFYRIGKRLYIYIYIYISSFIHIYIYIYIYIYSSQPGFDPSYGKILSSHTDEFW